MAMKQKFYNSNNIMLLILCITHKLYEIDEIEIKKRLSKKI